MAKDIESNYYEMVRFFCRTFGRPVNDKPTIIDDLESYQYIRLLKEELGELERSVRDNDLVEISDALADLSYVIIGMAVAYGINWDSCMHAVHDSNMTKLGVDGKPIYGPDGKIQKGPNYVGPNLEEVIYDKVSKKV